MIKQKEIIIRKAKIKDLETLADFGVQIMNYHYDLDLYYEPTKNLEQVYKKVFKKSILSKNELLLVAETKKKVIGYSLGYFKKRAPVYKLRLIGYISDSFILPEYRHKKILNLFLKKLFKWFKINNINYVELTVHTKNEIGKKAWKKYGFKEYMSKQVLKL